MPEAEDGRRFADLSANRELAFRRSPLLYVLTSLAAGIASAPIFSPLPLALVATISSFLLLSSAIALLRSRGGLSLLLSLSAIFFAAVGLERAREELRPASDVSRLLESGRVVAGEAVELIGLLARDPERSPHATYLYLELEEIGARRMRIAASGTARLSLYGKTLDALAGLRYGDRLRAIASLALPRGYLNPGCFDYDAHLKRNGISCIGSIKSGLLVERTGRGRGSRLISAGYALRRRLLDLTDRCFSNHPEGRAIAKALLLGDRSEMSREVEEQFKRTGLYHVLVVSGLHVAMIAYFCFLALRLTPLPRPLRAIIVISILILYSMAAGLRPPILRATLMVAAHLAGTVIWRESGLANSLSLAAVLLLAYNPGWLRDSGFQLSFGAVLAIALIAAPITSEFAAPLKMGFSSAFSPRPLLLEPTSVQRRARRIRFALEFLCEGMAARFGRSRSSPHLWRALLRPAGILLYHAAALFIVSCAVQLALHPLMALSFNRVSLSGIFFNLAIVPLASLLTLLLFMTLAASLFSSTIASFISWLAAELAGTMLATAALADSLQALNFRIPTPPLWLAIAAYAALLVAAASTDPLRRLALALNLFLLGIISLHPFPPQFRPGALTAVFLDVGHGDSIFLHFPQGSTMLIDGGGRWNPGRDEAGWFDIGEQAVSPFLWHRGVKRIDYLVLTHAHSDHAAGLLSIMSNHRIGRALAGRNPERKPEYLRLVTKAARLGIPLSIIGRGERFEIDDVEVEVLNPEPGPPPGEVSNNDSLVLRLQYGETVMLFTGDIEAEAERRLVADCLRLRADVLKVPHHGSATSSGLPFVACASPRHAIISAGPDSPFGHPAPSVIERYRQAGAAVYWTGIDGAIQIESDGRRLSVERIYKRR